MLIQGDLTRDRHKDLYFIYNHLNLPNSIKNSADSYITLTYTADGEKLTKVAGGVTRNYVAGIEYVGANLDAIYHTEGRCTPNGATAFYYEYTIKDHLGNARVNWRANGTAVVFIEDMHYYPFGMQMEGIGTQNPANKYLYNGKERNEDLGLNWYDYGARWYDPAVGRWWSVDPLAEEYFGWATYCSMLSNPIRLIDPDGRKIFDQNGTRAKIEYNEGEIKITNAGDLDANLVAVLINTFLENETGMEYVKKLDEDKSRFMVIVSDKAGLLEDQPGKFSRILGLTTDKSGYKKAIYLFNAEKTISLDPQKATIDDFDMASSGIGKWAFESEKYKSHVLKKYSKVGNNGNHKATTEAINKMSEEQKNLLKQIRIGQISSAQYGYIYTFIHEAVHALGAHDEYTPRITEIKAFCECNPDCSDCNK